MMESKHYDKRYALIIIQALVFITGALFSYKGFIYLSALTFICLAAVTYGYCYLKSKNLINITGLFSLSWVGAIGLTCLKLSKLQNTWGVTTWIAYAGAFIAFEIAVIIYNQKSKMQLHNKDERHFDVLTDIEKNKLMISMVAIDIISCVGMVFEWIKCGFLPVLSDVPHAYSYFHVSGVHYFTVSFVLVPALSVIYTMACESGTDRTDIISAFKSLKTKEKIMIILCDTVAILISVCIVSRFQLLFSVLLALVSYLYFHKNIKLRYIVFIFLGLILAWILLSVFRHHSASYLNEIFEFKNANTPVWITQPYTYICNNFENFNLMIEDTSIWGTYHGLRLLFPVIALTGLKFVCPSLVVGQVYVTKTELTTITLFYDAYYDFGIIGIIIYSALIALAVSYVNTKIFYKKDALLTIVGGQLTLYIILSFFTTWFSNPATWFYLIVSLIIYGFIKIDFKEKFQMIAK